MNARKYIRSILRIIIAAAVCLFILIMAAGVAVRQPIFGSYDFPPGLRADAKALRTHVEFLSRDLAPRNLQHPDKINRVADYIGATLVREGAIVSEQTYTVDKVRCRNIIGRFGSATGHLIVIGAHYDVHGDQPGADDNASGVAGVLELARLLKGRTLSSPIMLVAFSTEEPPYFGSNAMGSAVHAQALRKVGVDVAAMLSLEMIGYFSEEQLDKNLFLRAVYPQCGDFIVIAGRWSDRLLARQVKRAFHGAGSPPVYSFTGPIEMGIDLSDHRSYWAEGYSAVMVTDTAHLRNPNYHASGDRSETLDYDKMAKVVDGVFNAVVHLASQGK